MASAALMRGLNGLKSCSTTNGLAHRTKIPVYNTEDE